MKTLFLVFISYCFLVSCDPRDAKSMYLSGTISINAQVINPKTTISLGDSVAFYFEVPDTVILNGEKIKVTVSNNDGATNGFFASRIDTINTGGFASAPNENKCNIFANPGSLTSSRDLVFSNQNGKLIAKYYMIPQQKGVYFFNQSQFGWVDLNNQSLKLRFKFNFGNINRNHQMLIDSAGASKHFDWYLQDRLSKELEVYGFCVK